jgi:hypothetical protein
MEVNEFRSDESAYQQGNLLFEWRHASLIEQIGILYRYSIPPPQAA